MSLTYEQTQQRKKRLKELTEEGKISPKCPSCGGASLKFGEPLGGNLGPYLEWIGKIAIQRTCQDCGYIMLFDRKIVGV